LLPNQDGRSANVWLYLDERAMAAPGPSPTVNTQLLSEDGFWNFSNVADTVELNNFPASFGALIRMFLGNDVVTGANFNSPGWANQVNGNLGDDQLIGSILRDMYLGGMGRDVLAGNEGADWLNGNAGNDFVFSGTGNDVLSGGKNNDGLFGDDGNDILVGGFGRDDLGGGIGNDRFVLRTDSVTEGGVHFTNTSSSSSEVDVITDFSTNAGDKDKIVIPGVSSFSQLALTTTSIDGGLPGTLISFTAEAGGEHIGFVFGVEAETLGSGGGANFVLGATADYFLSKITSEFFLANPNMATDLIPV
jgi:Ca2+-binding RTX toxin-like protein